LYVCIWIEKKKFTALKLLKLWRPLQDRLFGLPVVALTPTTSGVPVVPQFSALAKALPSNLMLLTLHSQDAHRILLRLAHQFGLGEDATLSQPVTLDVAAVFNTAALSITDVTEVSLTNNQDLAAVHRHRAEALQWTPREPAAPHAWRQAPAAGTTVTLGPLEIKTFVLTLA